MPFESFSHVLITEELLRHVWDGEDDLTQGGHRYGLGREGKTEFPEHWDIDVLRQSIRLTLDKPQAIRVKNPYISCDRVVAQILIRVRLFRPQETVKVLAAYPICGEGVVRNQLGRRINLSLDFSRLET
jgi:hypothetical protein